MIEIFVRLNFVLPRSMLETNCIFIEHRIEWRLQLWLKCNVYEPKWNMAKQDTKQKWN